MNVKTTPFDPLRALRILVQHEVRFVVIGGLAARLWGSPTVTNDLDVCYSRDPANLRRLAAALAELEARLRGVDEEVPFQLEARTLRAGDHFTFRTAAGNLDCLGTPAGTEGYDDLVRTAQEIDLDDVRVNVAPVEDLIRMKRAAGRPKDRVELEILQALLEERDIG